ncbi:Protein patched 1 [Bulinus truncatus]|nr:Protein patched 1 [Bulinus truncatus]
MDVSFVHQELTGEVLKRSGVTVLLTSFSNILAFFTAAIIPIPALRAFTLQAGILVLFNLGSVLLVYPAIVSLDLVRREDKRIDVFCCFQSSAGSNDVIELQPHGSDDLEAQVQHRELTDLQREPSPPPPYTACGGSQPPCYDTVTRSESSGTVTTLAPNDGIFTRRLESALGSSCPSTTSSRQCLTPDNTISCKDRCVKAQKECLTWTLTCLAAKVYAPFLQRTFVKVTVIAAFLVLLIVGAWGTAQVKDGLDLTDIVPRDTAEFQFLEAQSKYFGFYSINLITQGDFDYANNQPLLYEYHNAFTKVKKIIKREDNTLTSFWLELFRQWLLDLQHAFDKDKDNKLISNEGWQPNASEEAILAYKLLIQTGDVNNPTNKNLATKNRLVDDSGIINPSGFYNYLSAWTTNDVMAYTYSMANFHPIPKIWQHDPTDVNFEVLKSQLLDYTQLPFYLTNLSSTEEVIEVITEIRSICEEFSKKGLPNFPSGVPFTFYEQYINLRFYLMLSLICVLVVTFIVLTVILMNPWIAAIVVVVLGMMIVELFGFMGVAGIKLSAVPAVILIVSVGIGVEFTLHLSVGFITAIGNRNKRMAMALEHTFTPVVHGAISTFLGILMLVGTEFDFIVKYFFNVLSALVLIGLFNGLMLLPVLLSIFGPHGEVVPKDNADRLASPTPEPSPKATHRYSGHSRRGSRRVYPRVNSDISLSTISEEPTQYSSHEIIVQPEVVVETTTLPGSCHDTTHHTQQVPCRPSAGHGSSQNSIMSTSAPVHSNRYNSSPPDSPPPPPPSHITRVKATATVKVEVHTPIPGCVNQEHTYKSKRRKTREGADNLSSGSSDSESSWHKHSSYKDSSVGSECHHCSNPSSCSNQLQPPIPQKQHRRSSRGAGWSHQSGKSSSDRQHKPPNRSNNDDNSDQDCSNV